MKDRKYRRQNMRDIYLSQRCWWRFRSPWMSRTLGRRHISEDLRLISACRGLGDKHSAFYRGGPGSMAG